jgi:hypothetical protein
MRPLALAFAFLLSMAVLAADPVKPAADDGWVELLKSGEGSPWQKVDVGWKFAKETALDKEKPNRLAATGDGNVWVNGTTGRLANLVTKQKYKDVEIHVEFLLGKNSNSGVKFGGVYEIQLRDTAGKKGELTGDDCGGIYPRAEEKPKYHHIDKGVAPKVNAARPAGEWQTLTATFRAPRFNEQGEKIENAKLVKATLNGQVIHENSEFRTPTGANYVKKETPTGPFLLQADHGPTAFRNVKIRELK